MPDTHTHADTHTHSLSLSLTHQHMHALSLCHTNIHTLSLSLSHTRTLSLAHTHTLSLSISHTHSLSHTHTQTIGTTTAACWRTLGEHGRRTRSNSKPQTLHPEPQTLLRRRPKPNWLQRRPLEYPQGLLWHGGGFRGTRRCRMSGIGCRVKRFGIRDSGVKGECLALGAFSGSGYRISGSGYRSAPLKCESLK